VNRSGQTAIAAMVKARECCRRLVQTYEQTRYGPDTANANPNGALRAADAAANRLLRYMRIIPHGKDLRVNEPDQHAYAQRLRAEIREMLEKAVILERETRYAMSVGNACRTGETHYD
jgi:hypothetical protein